MAQGSSTSLSTVYPTSLIAAPRAYTSYQQDDFANAIDAFSYGTSQRVCEAHVSNLVCNSGHSDFGMYRTYGDPLGHHLHLLLGHDVSLQWCLRPCQAHRLRGQVSH